MLPDILFRSFRDFISVSDFYKKKLAECCGGSRVIDLLLHFPSSISVRSGDIENFKSKLTVVVKIHDHIAPKNRSAPYRIIAYTQQGVEIHIVYFNYNKWHLRKTFPEGAQFTVSGNAKRTLEAIEIIHPDIVAAPSLYSSYVGIEPVYPLTARLTNKTVCYAIQSLLKILPEMPEWLPSSYISFGDALYNIHNPRSSDDLDANSPSRQRIALDELLAQQIKLRQIKSINQEHVSAPMVSTGELLSRVHLPFQLTDGQVSCIEDIKRDLASGRPMNRLIQGDVGSGKTIVAFLAQLIAIENHMQTVMLAPTAILAEQHWATFQKLFSNLSVQMDIMLGANRRGRAQQLMKLASGETQLLIATHAVLEDNVMFKNLGLVVIDEQHRFGVMQRLNLINKCHHPHLLTMSATPIPRTVLLGCYGDLDVSIVGDKPMSRRPITTIVMNATKVEALIEKIQKKDTQVFWVCPVIEESEELVDVYQRFEFLARILGESSVRVLHGRMNAEQKNDIMRQFRDNEFKILIATTVIEVGVDIPNANIIVIEHAERFGLAQLHQLRGRVGRGCEDSYCILLYHEPLSSVARKRLSLLRDTDDGFVLSEEDLKLRGAGDILGKEQSGFHSLRFSDYAYNGLLLQKAVDLSSRVTDSSVVDFLLKIFNRPEQTTIWN